MYNQCFCKVNKIFFKICIIFFNNIFYWSVEKKTYQSSCNIIDNKIFTQQADYLINEEILNFVANKDQKISNMKNFIDYLYQGYFLHKENLDHSMMASDVEKLLYFFQKLQEKLLWTLETNQWNINSLLNYFFYEEREYAKIIFTEDKLCSEQTKDLYHNIVHSYGGISRLIILLIGCFYTSDQIDFNQFNISYIPHKKLQLYILLEDLLRFNTSYLYGNDEYQAYYTNLLKMMIEHYPSLIKINNILENYQYISKQIEQNLENEEIEESLENDDIEQSLENDDIEESLENEEIEESLENEKTEQSLPNEKTEQSLENAIIYQTLIYNKVYLIIETCINIRKFLLQFHQQQYPPLINN